jgi:hypothetical protein
MALRIHCIGDSHCCFFLGYDHISKEYPVVAKSLMPRTFCYRLGPVLAYNLNKYGTATRGKEMLDEILTGLDPKKDILLLSFGEIDCRAHILKQVREKNADAQEVVDSCVLNYMTAVKEMTRRNFRVFIWNAVYSANYLEKNNDLEYPYRGTVKERNMITEMYNRTLNAAAGAAGAVFVDISGFLIDRNTGLTKDEFYQDSVHLNRRLFTLAIRKINSPGGNSVYNWYDLPIYRLRYMIRNIVDACTDVLEKLKRRLYAVRS